MKFKITATTEEPLIPSGKKKKQNIPVVRRKQVEWIIIPFLEAASWLKEHEDLLESCWWSWSIIILYNSSRIWTSSGWIDYCWALTGTLLRHHNHRVVMHLLHPWQWRRLCHSYNRSEINQWTEFQLKHWFWGYFYKLWNT